MRLLKKRSRWRVGSGLNIDIFKDRWLPIPPLYKPSSLPPFPRNFNVGMLRLESGDWNMPLIEHLFGDEDASVILSLPIGSFDYTYILIWHFTKDGEYSVKSGYKVALESKGFIEPSKSGPMQQWWKLLWGLNPPPPPPQR
ncbi:hypothetical protein UlMin_022572 [Ulmus minor]